METPTLPLPGGLAPTGVVARIGTACLQAQRVDHVGDQPDDGRRGHDD